MKKKKKKKKNFFAKKFFDASTNKLGRTRSLVRSPPSVFCFWWRCCCLRFEFFFKGTRVNGMNWTWSTWFRRDYTKPFCRWGYLVSGCYHDDQLIIHWNTDRDLQKLYIFISPDIQHPWIWEERKKAIFFLFFECANFIEERINATVVRKLRREQDSAVHR